MTRLATPALIVLGLASSLEDARCGPLESPAARAIERARAAVRRQPASCAAHNQLALAYARRARETAQTSFYEEADRALARSLELQPDNFVARKLRVWTLLGRHEFSRALEEAMQLHRQAPDDLQVNGFLVDAHVELGHYEAAEAAAQWLLDLRPGDIAGLTRAAYLRELFGEVDGAIELMDAAYQRTLPDEVEDRAWMLTQMAHLLSSTGRLDEAAATVEEALGLFPDYHYALNVKADLLTTRDRFAEAALVREEHVRAAPHPENLYALAEALERAGERERSGALFVAFEAAALREVESFDNANRELVFYYADHAGRPAEALRIARLELERRQDLFTRAAHAWALFVNGEVAAARQEMDRAMSVGIQEPRLRRLAVIIATGS